MELKIPFEVIQVQGDDAVFVVPTSDTKILDQIAEQYAKVGFVVNSEKQ